MSSDDWQYFMENYFGDPYMMWHDGIDTKSVTRLRGEEREKAEEMLIGAMESGSHWAAMGLRELRSKRAVPHLKKKLPTADGDLRLQIALALCFIEKTTQYVDYIIEILSDDSFFASRLNAAITLRHFPIPKVIDALFNAVSDPEYLVRNHACESILYIYGLPADISAHEDILAHIIVEYDPELKQSVEIAFEHYATAADMLRDLVQSQGSLRLLTFD